MKKLLLLLMALVGSISAFAQVSDVATATLQTDEGTTVFYGIDAFKDALAAAPNSGAVITLSPGGFSNPGAINKSVKIYGASFHKDEVNNIRETLVYGSLVITSTDELSPIVHVEGIYFSEHAEINGTQAFYDTEIVRCSFQNFAHNAESNHVTLRQCYIRGSIEGCSKKATALVVFNCYVDYNIKNFALGSEVLIDHCILKNNGRYSGNQFGPYVFTNNICDHSYNPINGGATCYNNVGFDGCFANNGYNTSSGNYDIVMWQSYGNLFADGQNNLEYYLTNTTTPRTWELKEPTLYVGTDGKPCGATGGRYPWNPITVIPRILNTTVDSESEFGKLNVTIKAEPGSAE